jgi:PadR family transcriptional regulator PadR
MAKQETEMLKGILEGVVLHSLSNESTHGYDIVSWLRQKGFSEIAEGTVYALLVRLEQKGFLTVSKAPSEKGPSRKIYTVNELGKEYLQDFWATWAELSRRIENIK